MSDLPFVCGSAPLDFTYSQRNPRYCETVGRSILTKDFPDLADSPFVAAGPTNSTRSVTDLDHTLQAFVHHFDRDAVDHRRAIRELLDSDPEAFYRSAMGILKERQDSRGCQYLVTLFVAYGFLLRALSDPALTREQALALARSAMRVDSLTDVSLAKALADSAIGEDDEAAAHEAGRLMEILAEISDGTRILPALMRLVRHANPRVRSKAVKMVGRGSRSVRWVQQRLHEADPRIRASAIEALWGVDTEEARELLWTATRDSNSRAAANALVALHQMGDCRSVPEIFSMADHESPLFRASAAWLMGASGDPRFSETLARLMRDADPCARSRALSSLRKIKAALAESRQGEHWVVSAVAPDSGGRVGQRRVVAAIANSETHQFPKLLGTQFLVSENGQVLTQYKVLERAVAESMSVVFLVPRVAPQAGTPWSEGTLACLPWKRPSDLWAVAPYLLGEEAEGEQVSLDEPPRFTTHAAFIEDALAHPVGRPECADLWRSIWRAAPTDHGQSRGRRHLILFCEADPHRTAGDGLISAVMSSHASVQVIARERSPRVEDFCARARASFHVAENDGAAAHAIEMAYLRLLARYDIVWQSNAVDLEPIRVRVNSPTGWGEAEIPLALPPA